MASLKGRRLIHFVVALISIVALLFLTRPSPNRHVFSPLCVSAFDMRSAVATCGFLTSHAPKRHITTDALSLRVSTFVARTVRRPVLATPRQQSSCRRTYRAVASLVMMPEGPEVRTLVNQLREGGGVGQRLVDWRFVSGRYIRHSKPVGWEAFCTTMTPLKESNKENDDNDDSDSTNTMDVDVILEWNCKGKFMYLLLDDGGKAPACHDNKDDDFARSVWITLGMTGRFVSQSVHDGMSPQDQQQARWYMELAAPPPPPRTNETTTMTTIRRRTRIYYYDPRNFGTLRFCLSREELAEKLQSLGPDILQTDTTTPQALVQLVQASKPSLNICRFLMDQSKISGIGNYILAEGLYRAKIDPFATLGDLTVEQQECLFRELQQVAVESYQSQGMTRANGGQYRTVTGSYGQYTFDLQCYGRTVAANGEVVIKEINGPHGRTIWYTQEQLFRPRPKAGVPQHRTFVARMKVSKFQMIRHRPTVIQ